jgi:hypothetical protein
MTGPALYVVHDEELLCRLFVLEERSPHGEVWDMCLCGHARGSHSFQRKCWACVPPARERPQTPESEARHQRRKAA